MVPGALGKVLWKQSSVIHPSRVCGAHSSGPGLPLTLQGRWSVLIYQGKEAHWPRATRLVSGSAGSHLLQPLMAGLPVSPCPHVPTGSGDSRAEGHLGSTSVPSASPLGRCPGPSAKGAP